VVIKSSNRARLQKKYRVKYALLLTVKTKSKKNIINVEIVKKGFVAKSILSRFMGFIVLVVEKNSPNRLII
jgi:hypothetical protein